jgi:tetratricopeptide (TPR) repeat protein
MAKRKPLARAVEQALPPPARAARAQPAALVAPAPPAHEAVLLFQRGMEALQRHSYAEAAPAFQAIVMGFPTERALLDRARVYLGICERESKKRPASARGALTLEERLTAATAALNNGEDHQAEELARGVLGDDPKHDLALYLLAAVHARRGATSDALDLLAKVIAVSPETSAQARSDEDFTSLHDDDAFWRLTEPPIVLPGNARRRPRGR